MQNTHKFRRKWRGVWMWLAPLLIALAILAWSLYWSYVNELDRDSAFSLLVP